MTRPSRLLLAPALLALAIVHVGCASTRPRPQTGDLSFRLLWDGPADLDLHVEDPRGRHVGTVLPFDLAVAAGGSPAGPMPLPDPEDPSAVEGILDVDCNSSPQQLCERPIENVYWPTGGAPRGEFRARVVLFQTLHLTTDVPFVLEVRRGREVVETVRGAVGPDERASPWFPFAH